MEYHQIVVLHRIAVTLFLLHYVVKGYFLLADKKETLAGYTAKTKIAEMILSVLFLATGIYLAFEGPALSGLQITKFVLVFASIPLAIIGFKRGKKPLAIIAILFLIAAYGLAEMNKAKNRKLTLETDSSISADPKIIYNENCVRCHGDHGDAMIGGAKNLKLTQLTDEQMKDIIKNGRPGTQMVGYKALTDDQLNGLVSYIKTLKQ